MLCRLQRFCCVTRQDQQWSCVTRQDQQWSLLAQSSQLLGLFKSSHLQKYSILKKQKHQTFSNVSLKGFPMSMHFLLSPLCIIKRHFTFFVGQSM